MRIIFILSIGLLINVVYSALTVDSSALGAFGQFPVLCILALAAMVVLPWLADSIRWQVWLRFLGKRERFTDVFRITLASEMASAVTPAAIGGTGARVGWMISRGLAPGIASSIMLVAVLEDNIFFILALPSALLFSSNAGSVPLDKFWHSLQQRGLAGMHGLGLLLLGIIVLCLAGLVTWKFLPHSLKSRLRGYWEKIKAQIRLAKQTLRLMVAKGGWRFFVNVGLSGLHWTCRLSMLTVLLVGLHQYVDPFNFFASQWLVFMVTKLVPSPGGTGGAELTFLFLYRSLLPENLLGLLVGAWRMLTFTLPVGLATLFFLLFMRHKKRAALQGSP